jgi:hypothetical protein
MTVSCYAGSYFAEWSSANISGFKNRLPRFTIRAHSGRDYPSTAGNPTTKVGVDKTLRLLQAVGLVTIVWNSSATLTGSLEIS